MDPILTTHIELNSAEITVKNLFINTIFYNKGWVKIKYWSQLLTHYLKKKKILQVWKKWGWVNDDRFCILEGTIPLRCKLDYPFYSFYISYSYIMPTPAINVESKINCSYYNQWSSILWKYSLQSVIMLLKLNKSVNIIFLIYLNTFWILHQCHVGMYLA